jgi:hypothetical protein
MEQENNNNNKKQFHNNLWINGQEDRHTYMAKLTHAFLQLITLNETKAEIKCSRTNKI